MTPSTTLPICETPAHNIPLTVHLRIWGLAGCFHTQPTLGAFPPTLTSPSLLLQIVHTTTQHPHQAVSLMLLYCCFSHPPQLVRCFYNNAANELEFTFMRKGRMEKGERQNGEGLKPFGIWSFFKCLLGKACF